jgi:hypothetical protein
MAQKRKAIDSTVIARVVAPVKQAETAGTAGLSWLVLLFCPIQAKFNRASRPPQGFSAADPGIVEYYTI